MLRIHGIRLAVVFIAPVPVSVQAPFPHATSHFHADPVGILLMVREIILLMPPFLAIVNGMGWWAVRNKPTIRPALA